MPQQQLPGYGHGYSHINRLVFVGRGDNFLARRELAEAVLRGGGNSWAIDCGNGRSSAQILAGDLTGPAQIVVDELGLCRGLPSPYLQEPGLLEQEPGLLEPDPAGASLYLAPK